MTTVDWAKSEIIKKGWQLNSIEYSKPKSGFMCIEGGFICFLETDESHYDILNKVDTNGIFGSIEPTGIILALHKKEFIKLIKLLPIKSI